MNQFNSPYFPQIPELGEYIDRNSSLVQKLINDKSRVIEKWETIISRGFNDIRLTDEVISNICIYCEVCNSYYENLRQVGFKIVGNELAGVLDQIRNNISNKEANRSAVVRKVYNHKTGFMEYELEDGTFVKIITESVSGPKMDVSKDIFCEQFVKQLDLQSYRNIKIDKIL
jgi:hypothetical protein